MILKQARAPQILSELLRWGRGRLQAWGGWRGQCEGRRRRWWWWRPSRCPATQCGSQSRRPTTASDRVSASCDFKRVWFVSGQITPDPHCELVCGTDPYEVEVGEGPWKAKGETPTHHDAKIGEENNRDESKHYRTNLLIWVLNFLPTTSYLLVWSLIISKRMNANDRKPHVGRKLRPMLAKNYSSTKTKISNPMNHPIPNNNTIYSVSF